MMFTAITYQYILIAICTILMYTKLAITKKQLLWLWHRPLYQTFIHKQFLLLILNLMGHLSHGVSGVSAVRHVTEASRPEWGHAASLMVQTLWNAQDFWEKFGIAMLTFLAQVIFLLLSLHWIFESYLDQFLFNFVLFHLKLHRWTMCWSYWFGWGWNRWQMWQLSICL